jgi:dihydroxy-acid dehydratase
VLGACTDCRRLWGKYRAGEIDDVEIEAVNGRLAPSVGTCMVMGTASTMACITEGAGLSLPMSATIPAPHAERFRSARRAARWRPRWPRRRGPRPSEFLTAGGVPQRAGRAAGDRRLDQRPHSSHRDRQPHRHRIDLEAFDKLGREVPVLIDLKPSGEHYMEHFHHAGGVPKLMAQLGDLSTSMPRPSPARRCAMSSPMPRRCRGRTRSAARQSDQAEGAMAVLHGNLAPRGAVIKHRRRARNCCSTPAAPWCSNPSRT